MGDLGPPRPRLALDLATGVWRIVIAPGLWRQDNTDVTSHQAGFPSGHSLLSGRRRLMFLIVPSVVVSVVLVSAVYALARSWHGIAGACWLTCVTTVLFAFVC